MLVQAVYQMHSLNLVDDGGRGGIFQLRDVPNDEPGMAPHEIWCNESQERYVMAVAPENLAKFEEICKRERADRMPLLVKRLKNVT